MAGNKIGIILAVDGEREFRDAMTNAANAAKAVKAELQALEGVYSGNANSLEALTKKQELLEKQQEKVKAALEQAKAGYDNAQKAVEKHRSALDSCNHEIEEAEKELRQLRQAYGDTSDEVKQQEKRLSDLKKTQDEEQRSLASAENCTQKWAKKVSSASKDVQKNSKALQQNEKLLDEAKNSTDQCAHSIDGYENQVREATEATEDWRDSLKTGVAVAAADLAKGALGALADKAKEAAKFVVDVGSSFDKAMSEVAALSGASGSELDALSAKAKELGASTRFSATEAAEAFKYMSLAGWDANTSLEAIDGVMQLAAASGMDLASASDMITDYLSAFSMEASEATRVADMLAYAQGHSNTSAAQLGEAYGNCAAGLNTAGQSIETVTAMLEAMANQGTKGSAAGTALNSIMAQITQKMKNGAIQIGETTIAVQDQAGNFRDLVDIVADVEKATDGMGSAERSAALGAVFNRTALSGLNLVLNEGADNVKGYRDELSKADGAAAGMATTMQDNLQGDLTTLNSSLEGLGIAAYQYVDGPLRGVVKGVTNFISGITDTITPQKTALETFISDIQLSNAAVQTSLDNAKAVITGYEADSVKLEAYATALKEVAGATETTEFQKYEISKIVKELADDIPELSEAWDEEAGVLHLTAEEVDRLMAAYSNSAKQEAYIKAMKSANDALIESELNVAKANSAVKKAQEEMTSAQEAYNTSREKYRQLRQETGTKPGEIEDEEAEALKRAQKALEDATEAQIEANRTNQDAREEYELITDTLTELGAQVDDNGNVIVSSMEEAADAAGDLADAVEDIDPEQLERLEKAAEDMQTGITNSMQGAVSVFKDFEANSADSLDTIIQRLETQKQAIDGWAANMETLASQIGEGMSQEFYDYLAQLGPEQGAALVQQLVDSMQAGDGEFEEVSKAWTEAMDVSADAAKITEATQAGKDLADAYSQGITDNTSQAGDAADTLREEAVQRLGTGAEPAREHGKQLAEEYAKGLEESADKVEAATDQYGSAGAGVLMNQDSNFRKAGEANAEAYSDGLIEKEKEVFDEQGKEGFGGIAALTRDQAQYEEAGKESGEAYGEGLEESGIAESTEAAIDEAIETVKEKAEEYEEAAKESAESMSAGMENAQAEVASGAETAADAGVEALQDKSSDFQDAGEESVSNVAEGMEGAEAKVEQSATQVYYGGINALLAGKGYYGDAGKELVENTASGMESAGDSVQESSGGVAYAGISAILAEKGGYYSAGQDLASGTGGGISSMASYVMEKARQIVRDALSAAKNEAGIHSPSKKWKKEVGEMLTKGMAEGIKAGKADAENAAREISDAVYDKATAWLKKKKKTQTVSVKDEEAFWKSVAAAAKKGVEEYNKQVKKAADVSKQTDAAENRVLAAQVSKRFGVSRTETTGSGSNKKTVKKDTETYYSDIYSAAKKYLDNYETLHDISLQQELAYWKKVQKTLKKGTQAWYDAQKQINSINDQIKKAKAASQSETLAADEAYVKKRTYMGKMDTESELAYWKQQIKGFKKYSDEWYTITDRIKTLEQDLAAAKAAAQAEMLSSQEAYVKEQIYRGKMDTGAQIAYWEAQIKAYKEYSDEWYTITDNLKSLREQEAAEEAGRRTDLLSGMEREADRKRTLENQDAAWELEYWKNRIGQFGRETDEYLEIYKKIAALEEEIAASRPDPAEEAKQQRQTLASVQNSILTKYKTYYKVSLKAEAQYWDAARKQFTEGTDERIEADQRYFEAAEAYTKQREQLEKDYLEEQQSIMDEEKSNIEELTKAYTDAVTQREQAILQSFGLFDAWDNEGYTTDAMLYNARTQIEGLKLWEQELTALRDKNLPQELMEQLEKMGPEATANIYTLNRMTDSELDEWVSIWREKQAIAKRQAEKQSKGDLDETAQGIADAQSEAQKKLAALKQEYASDLDEINAGISNSLSGLIGQAKTIGEDTVSSLVAGIKTKMNENLPGMEAYYSDWESKWMSGMNHLNAVTSAGAGSTPTQTVAVDTGNIAGILVAILASLNDVKDGVGNGGSTITLDELTAKISTNMAAYTYRSTRGSVV